MNVYDCKSLKGASHEIELRQIWYQKKDLEKLEQRGWVQKSTDTFVQRYLQITCSSALFLYSNLFETIPKPGNNLLIALNNIYGFRGFSFSQASIHNTNDFDLRIVQRHSECLQAN